MMVRPDAIGARLTGRGAPRVIVPVKALNAAKTRLAGVLTPRERRCLVLAMLRDVLAAVHTAGLSEIAVLSPDRTVLELAAALGAQPLRQRSPEATLNEALDEAVAAGGAVKEPLLVLPADVPLVSPAELSSLVATAAPGPRGASADAVVALVPDRAGSGTNALLRRPASVIPAAFGTRSLELHRAAAAAAGVPCRVYHLPGLAQDIDTPADLAAFRALPSDTHTRRFLVRLAVTELGGATGLASSHATP